MKEGLVPPEPERPGILVVDDDETMRRALARALGPLERPILLTDSARQARELCAARPRLAAALVDLDLGDGYGADLIDELREHLGSAAPPFIILSGARPRRRPDGVVAVLSKPVSLAELLRTLKPLLAFAPGSPQRGSGDEPHDR